MQSEIDDLAEWSKANHMNINTNKTQEMLIGHIKKEFSPTLQLGDNEIERVSVYKLLGLYMNNNLTWDDHVTSICAKSAKRLHFLKLLKRAAMSADDLLYYYKSVIRPVTDYSSFVWHSSLTKEQANQLENIQRRAVRLIFGNNNQDMNSAMSSLTSLADRREHLAKHFFEGLLSQTNCLHHLLPPKRDLAERYFEIA
jgi:Mg2+ and Co2+ transporter CorA